MPRSKKKTKQKQVGISNKDPTSDSQSNSSAEDENALNYPEASGMNDQEAITVIDTEDITTQSDDELQKAEETDTQGPGPRQWWTNKFMIWKPV